MRNFSQTIARLGNDCFTVVRKTPGHFEKGRYVPSNDIERFSGIGSIQPMTAEELQFLPEGQRSDEVRKLYTEVELRAEDEPDHVEFDGITYEVQADLDWKNAGNYLRYKLVKAGQ